MPYPVLWHPSFSRIRSNPDVIPLSAQSRQNHCVAVVSGIKAVMKIIDDLIGTHAVVHAHGAALGIVTIELTQMVER